MYLKNDPSYESIIILGKCLLNKNKADFIYNHLPSVISATFERPNENYAASKE